MFKIFNDGIVKSEFSAFIDLPLQKALHIHVLGNVNSTRRILI